MPDRRSSLCWANTTSREKGVHPEPATGYSNNTSFPLPGLLMVLVCLGKQGHNRAGLAGYAVVMTISETQMLVLITPHVKRIVRISLLTAHIYCLSTI